MLRPQIGKVSSRIAFERHFTPCYMVNHRVALNRYRASFTRPHAAPDLSFALGTTITRNLRLTGCFESSTQKPLRGFTVDVLGATPIDTDLDACGFVRQNYTRVGDVPVLTSFARTTDKLLLDITRINLDFVLGGFFQNRNRDGRSLNSAAFFSGRYALNPMTPSFVVESCVRSFAANAKHEEPWPQVKDVMVKDTPGPYI